MGFPAFGATFAILVWIWYYHYVYFRRYGLVDARTTFLNGVLLFLILFYVYPLKFLFSALLNGLFTGPWAFTLEEAKTILAVYSLGFAAVFAMFALLYRHAIARQADLELDPRETFITAASLWSNLLLVGLATAIAAASWLGPPWIAPIAAPATH